MFLVVMPVVVPFLRSHGLSMQDVFVLQAIFALATLTLELPSGYLADLIGRKHALVLACVAKGCAFSWLAMSDSFFDFAIFEVLAAVSISLFSGSDIAMIYESLENVPGNTRSPAHTVGQKLFYSQIGETAAALLGGSLALVALDLPVLVNAAIAWVPLPIALSLYEPDRVRMDRHRHGENLRHVGRALFQQGVFLPLLLANMIVFGAATLIGVWAYQAYWEELGIGLAAFGLLWALSNLSVAVTARLAHRFEDAVGFGPVVAAIGLLPVLGYAGMGMASGSGAAVIGVTAGLLLAVSRGLNFVVLRDKLNASVPAEMRATVNSVASLGVRMVFAVSGPLVGRAMDATTVTSTLGMLGPIFAVAFLVVSLPLALRRT